MIYEVDQKDDDNFLPNNKQTKTPKNHPNFFSIILPQLNQPNKKG